jgi:hypothetical protein
VSWLRSSLADRLPRGELIALDPRVLTLVAVTTLAVTFLCALPGGVTLLRRRLDGSLLARAWQERGTHRFATAAIGTEAALAVVLVALSLLLTRSVFAIASVDPGWNPAGLVTARLELTGASETTPESRRALYQDLLERLRVLPGVEGAALSGVQLPLVDGQGSFELFVEGQPRTETPQIVVTAQYVSPDYFATMGIRTAEGALFTPQSSWDHAHEVVVNRTFAQR